MICDLHNRGMDNLMRRIDMVNNKNINVKNVKFLDKKRIKITFRNNEYIILKAQGENYGTDCGIYIEVDNI